MARGLGKGLDSILPTELDVSSLVGGVSVKEIDITRIHPNPDQPRRTISKLQLDELKHSIAKHGVLQPLLVVLDKDDSYMIIAGERRWRASEQAGLKTVPCIVRTMDELDQLQVALIENIQREDLNAIEQAVAIKRLIDDFDQSYEDVAKSLGRAYSSVINTARLLKLPEEMQTSIVNGEISEGHGRALLALDKHPEAQKELYTLIVQNAWSVRRSEQYVKEAKSGAPTPDKTKRSSSLVENTWTKKLGSKLDTKVQINPTAKGGFIKISYKDEQELERLQTYLDKD